MNPKPGDPHDKDPKLATTRSAPPPGGATNPVGSPYAADRLTVLAHDLAGMIDGSMRWLALATDTLPESTPGESVRMDEARGQIESVRQTLERMAGLVGGAMMNGAVAIGSPLLGAGQSVSVGEAIDHAVDVVRPLAHEYSVEIDLCIDRASGTAPSGALYSVILNGMRNAVEAIGRAPTRDRTTGGKVEVTTSITGEAGGVQTLTIEIADDGPGPDDAVSPFQNGYSTKNTGNGLGLGLSRQLIEGAGGTIDLVKRESGTGALLRIVVPVPTAPDGLIGTGRPPEDDLFEFGDEDEPRRAG
ncbi:MAG: hypothetical protein DHS20C14_15360 [Phycisphaeraceae bacterium]|nr:MAG: hypothetical protein DHS20C14_15360 [Phycisphaeraceae bacterium]